MTVYNTLEMSERTRQEVLPGFDDPSLSRKGNDETPQLHPVIEKQFRILMEVSRRIDIDGYPPTIREMLRAAKTNSTSVVNHNLNRLDEYGYIQKSEGKSRGLRILIEPHKANLGFDPNEVFTKEFEAVEG